MRIIIVEDEALLALWMRSVLEEAGHTVVGETHDTAEVLALLRAVAPDLMLVDINLPEGRGAGIELARMVRAGSDVPCLFVSGQVEEARANSDVALGLLNKPWDAPTLLASVDIAGQLMCGDMPHHVPLGLELFGSGGGTGP